MLEHVEWEGRTKYVEVDILICLRANNGDVGFTVVVLPSGKLT
jgi:hypothetical protein